MKRGSKILFLFVLSIFLIGSVNAVWWDNNFIHKTSITLNSTVSSNLTDFPALTVLDTATLISEGKMNSSCKDLRVINSAENTVLDYEIETGTCNTTNTVIWTRLPSLNSGNQIIYIYYGNPSASDGQNVAGVWQNYSWVNHHLNSGITPSKPTSVTLNKGTAVSFTSSDVNITGSNKSVHTSGTTSAENWYGNGTQTISHNISKGFYISARFYTTADWGHQEYPFNFEQTLGSGNGIAFHQCGDDSGGSCTVDNVSYWKLQLTVSTGTAIEFAETTPYNQWVMLQATGNTDDDRAWVFQNGVFDRTEAVTIGTGDFNFYSIVGATGTGNQGVWNGYIDEVRLGEFNASVDWIKAEYGQTYLVGTETTQPLPPQNATFENVNVTNNLTVENNVSATRGFFTFLGSFVSRITKGWFNDLDVSGTTNLTGQTYLLNASCSAGQVLTTNAAGLVSCTNKADIKSGSVSVTEGTCTFITFNTAFLSTPVATGNAINTSENNVITIGSLSITGFNLCMQKVGGGPASSYTVYWTANNAENP